MRLSTSSCAPAVYNDIKVFIRKNRATFNGSIFFKTSEFRELIMILMKGGDIFVDFNLDTNPLSTMETITLALFFLSASTSQISTALCVSKNTIKTYFMRIKEKMNVEKKMEAVMLALRIGIIVLR